MVQTFLHGKGKFLQEEGWLAFGGSVDSFPKPAKLDDVIPLLGPSPPLVVQGLVVRQSSHFLPQALVLFRATPSPLRE